MKEAARAKKDRQGNINVKEPIVPKDVDVPENPLEFPKNVAAGPIEADRANYNFPIKTSVEKTPLSTSTRESFRYKRDRSLAVKNVRRCRWLDTRQDETLNENFLRRIIPFISNY